jgi:hypothetical protein
MRSACDNVRQSTVKNGLWWSLTGTGRRPRSQAFPQVKIGAEVVVVRDRIELSTFRFSDQPR